MGQFDLTLGMCFVVSPLELLLEPDVQVPLR